MPTLHLPQSLKHHCSGQSSVFYQKDTLANVLQQLVMDFPALEPYLFSNTGEVCAFTRIYLNKIDIRQIDQNKILNDNDELVIIPAMIGG